jgi:toxin YoeB
LSAFVGIGKPEPLRGDLAGFWSRRIDDANRLVYEATEAEIRVVACRYQYGANLSAAVQRAKPK